MTNLAKIWSNRMRPNLDTGADIGAPELDAAIEAGWWLMRQWSISDGEVVLALELKRKVQDGGGDMPPGGWVSYQRTYSADEIDMLTQDIIRGHVLEMAQRAMSEYPSS